MKISLKATKLLSPGALLFNILLPEEKITIEIEDCSLAGDSFGGPINTLKGKNFSFSGKEGPSFSSSVIEFSFVSFDTKESCLFSEGDLKIKKLRNSILRSATLIFEYGGKLEVGNSDYNCFDGRLAKDCPDFQAWRELYQTDSHSFSANPLFATEDSELHLQSTWGRKEKWCWVRDWQNSPCIDRADPAEEIGAEPWPNGGRRNLGRWGGTAEASKSPITPLPLELYLLAGIFELVRLENREKRADAALYCIDRFRRILQRIVGPRNPDGSENPRIYQNKTFKEVVVDLLVSVGGFGQEKLDIQDIELTFRSLSFSEETLGSCLSKLAEAASGTFTLLASGRVSFREFDFFERRIWKPITPSDQAQEITFQGQSLLDRVVRVLVEGRDGVFGYSARPETEGKTVKIRNTTIESDAVASKVAEAMIGRFSGSSLLRISGVFLPSFDVRALAKVVSTISGLSSAPFEVLSAKTNPKALRTDLELIEVTPKLLWKATYPETDYHDMWVPPGAEHAEFTIGRNSGTITYIFDAGDLAVWVDHFLTFHEQRRKYNTEEVWAYG